MSPEAQSDVVLRPATPQDAPVCGQICYQAFSKINAEHNFPCDFPAPEVAVGLLSHLFAAPGLYCVVAERKGRILGSNVLDERASIAGIGPITVDPAIQNSGVGRKLMQAVIDRANESKAAGIRLIQAAFHNRSFALYTSLGFRVREPLCCLQGRTAIREVPGCRVRPAEPAHLDACNALSREVHGFDRGADLAQSIERKVAIVVERAGRISGYSSEMAFFGHSAAETNVDLQALIASTERFGGPGILVPSRNSALLHWCLANGLRIVQPMNLMSIGLYNEPEGAWLPSVMF